MGIFDDALKRHLETVTKTFKNFEYNWRSQIDSIRNMEINDAQNPNSLAAERAALDRNADKLRAEGNTFFKARDFHNARLLYTQSIASAIGGPLGALAYFNRSAALFQMKHYKDCVKDIDRALVLGYPKSQQLYTVYLRKAKSLKFLGKDFSECLSEAIKAIEENNKGDVKMLNDLVLAKMEEPEPVFSVSQPTFNKWNLPKLSYGQNPEVPSFSSAVSVEHSKELGRHLVANRAINTGDVMIVDECIVSSIYKETHWDFCNFCYKHCLSLIPCKLCGYTMYCTVKCRDTDWSSVHSHMCDKSLHLQSSVPLQLAKTQFFLADSMTDAMDTQGMVNRLIAFIGLEIIKKVALENKPLKSLSGNQRTKGFHEGKFEAITLEAVLSLVDNFDKLTDAEKMTSSFLSLSMCGEHKIAPSQWLPVAAIFLKLFLVLQFNHKVIDAYKANYHSVSLPRLTLGKGLFLASSLVNHGCDATMYQVSYGTTAVFRARRPISKGEQLTNCYYMPATNHGGTERRKELLEAYKFTCSCPACAGCYPTMENLPHLSVVNSQFCRMLAKAGIKSKGEISKLQFFCHFNAPVTKQMLPKLLTLLRSFHNSDQKLSTWYFQLQETIKNYYRTKGSCLFFEDTKAILSGDKDFDGDKAYRMGTKSMLDGI